MKARLYQFNYSPPCAKVRKLLHYKGIDFEPIEVDYLERKELMVASGQIKTPALTMPDGEALVGSSRIALRLEELHPNPTILPDDMRGIHLALTNHIESAVKDAILRLAVPDMAEYWRRRGADRLAMWKYARDRRYGEGFCDRMAGEIDANRDAVHEALASFESALHGKAFILGRIGLADFALYGQLYMLAFSGELKLPAGLPNLHAFFGRMDRLSALPESAD
jgi:glutathione S-transferase